jgi:hypothetical protein
VDIAYEGSQASRIYKYNFKPSRSHLLSNIRYARALTAARQNRMLDMMFHAGKSLPSVMNIHVHNQGSSMKLIIHTCITGITGVSQFVSNMDKQ